MKIEILAEQNPWWKGKQKIEQDYDIQRWKEKKYKWKPDFLKKITTQPSAFHILLGPRQVGKTTAVKLFIKKLLEKRKPESLFYFNCEEVGDYKELLAILETYIYFKNANDVENSLIILDEVTSTKEWYKAVKSWIDKGKLRKDTLLVTGSTSMKIKREVELFPGRRGKGKDFVLLPLSFRNFLKVTNQKLWEKISPLKNIDELEKKAAKAAIYLDELNKGLLRYMGCGGFPVGIEFAGEEKERAKKIYLNWIKNAILKAERNDLIAREIIKAIVEKMPSTISWEGVSREIEVKSPKTVAAYVDMFKNMFALTVLYNIDINKKKIKFGKNKKMHVLDPLLFEIFENWCLLDIKNKKNILAESMAAVHLNRMFPEKTFFWKNSFEIDIIIMDKIGLRGFEVKWTRKKPKAKKLPQLKQFVILSKKDFSRKPLTIPLSVFLALLDVEE